MGAFRSEASHAPLKPLNLTCPVPSKVFPLFADLVIAANRLRQKNEQGPGDKIRQPARKKSQYNGLSNVKKWIQKSGLEFLINFFR